MKIRLEYHLNSIGGQHDRQYEFRRGRSTVDAITKVMELVDKASSGPLYNRELCCFVALDVANAFNTAGWM